MEYMRVLRSTLALQVHQAQQWEADLRVLETRTIPSGMRCKRRIPKGSGLLLTGSGREVTAAALPGVASPPPSVCLLAPKC